MFKTRLQKYYFCRKYYVMQILKDAKPISAFFALLFLIVVVGITSTSIGLFVGYLLYGNAIIGDSAHAVVGQMKYMQLLTQMAFFVAPAWLFAYLVQRDVPAFFHLRRPPVWHLLLVAILIMLAAMPFNDFLVYLNHKIHLPQALSGVEAWMRAAEDRAADLMAVFLQMDTFGDYVVNILLIGLLAGVSEELMMRGVLQPLFIRWTRNVHVGIWIAAFIFSFIHLQFYGFFARMFLGAVLGYLYLYTSNLWVPIIAHFFNNAAAVSFVYFTGQMPEDTSGMFERLGQGLWPVALVSLLLVLMGLRYVQRRGGGNLVIA